MTNIYCTLKNAERLAKKQEKAKLDKDKSSSKRETITCKKNKRK